jgi:hypothetical protein
MRTGSRPAANRYRWEYLPVATAVQTDRDPDETVDLRALVAQVIDRPDLWMDTPNDVLGGHTPNDLIRAGQGERIRELVRAIKAGLVS